MEIKLETATTKLLDNLFAIENQCFDQEAFTKRQISYLLADYNTLSLVAKTGNEIAGFIITQIEIDESTLFGHIITVNVSPRYRRKGIATKMLRQIEEMLKEKGIFEIHLEVREDNSAAIKLYQKSGYQKTSKLQNYYGNKHGLYLKKTL